MKTIEYQQPDLDLPKKAWGDGPWLDEPDKVQWQDEATGMPCLIVRNRMGSLCGYVGVSRTHPLYGKDYDQADEFVHAHGGLTFASKCAEHEEGPDGESLAVCHVVEPGEDDDVWWFGFDCGHSGDYQPAMIARNRDMYAKVHREMGAKLNRIEDGLWWDADNPYDHEKAVASGSWMVDTYRTLGYVKNEVRELAEQLVALQEGKDGA